MRRALARVADGELDVQIPVYDGTQIGQLPVGFNLMMIGLAERQRIRDAFGIYVDPAVAERILAEGTSLEGEEVGVTDRAGHPCPRRLRRVEAATRQTGDTILLAERTSELLRTAQVQLVAREDVMLKGRAAPLCCRRRGIRRLLRRLSLAKGRLRPRAAARRRSLTEGMLNPRSRCDHPADQASLHGQGDSDRRPRGSRHLR